MPSSSRPYQSKLLRFVLQQWQQGIERQNRAFRQLQSTAVWGTQVAVFPIYAIMRAAQRASLTLGSSRSHPQPPETVSQVHQSVTDLDHSLTAILTYTQQQLSARQTKQLGMSKPPSHETHHPQTNQKITVSSNERLPTWVYHLQKWLPFKRRSPNPSGMLQTSSSPSSLTTRKTSIQVTRSANSGLFQQGTTLASCLETKALVMVNLKNETFDIFTPKQQIDLQHYIDRIMCAYRQTLMLAPRPRKQLSVKTVLAIGGVFVAALPTELQKAWDQITSGSQEPTLPNLARDGSQPSSRVFHPYSSSKSTVRTRARRLQTSSRFTDRHLPSQSPHAVEADIHDIGYLEHPLERVLRWIDRVLTWCEQRWQNLLNHKTSKG